MRIYRGGKLYMFDKIKYLIDMNVMSFWYSFYTNYMKGVLKNNSNKTEIFDRPNKYLNGLDDAEYDFIINGYPVWVESIDSSEFIDLVNIFPNISDMMSISPFCSV